MHGRPATANLHGLPRPPDAADARPSSEPRHRRPRNSFTNGPNFGNPLAHETSNLSAGQKRPAGGKTLAFEDASLVDRVKKGDMEAFADLVAKYQDRVYNLMLRMSGQTADAEELTQDAFLRALERIGQYHGRSGFYTWLFRVAANLALSRRRRAARVQFHSLDATDDDGNGRTQADNLTAAMARRRDPSPEDAAMKSESRQRVLAALGELDDEFRLAVVLCDIEQMDYATAAEVAGVPLGTIKSRLHRGRCLLRTRLASLVGYDR